MLPQCGQHGFRTRAPLVALRLVYPEHLAFAVDQQRGRYRQRLGITAPGAGVKPLIAQPEGTQSPLPYLWWPVT